MLYNAATNVDKQDFDYSTNAPFAVRNARYKLIHFFDSPYAAWYEPGVENADDDGPNTSMCSTTSPVASMGSFVYALFDLDNDPYEQVNLFGRDEDAGVVAAKAELYQLMDALNLRSARDDIRSFKVRCSI